MQVPQRGLPAVGDVVASKYRIDGTIGAGGMGVVMAALDTSLGRPVAIKFLAPQKALSQGAIPRFQREARAAAAIQSEHVVRVFDVGALPSGSPFIVMELLRGIDLGNLVERRGGLPIQEAVDYVLQTCEALGEAHMRGIVHRDLKPQNLFLAQFPDGSPCIKVLDFGISKASFDDAPNLTATDVVMGTPLYMSPEQVRSLKSVDHRSDVWALGVILFELLTASPVFDAPTASALCAMIAMDAPASLRQRRPDAPIELEGLIFRCLQKDPNARFQDVATLADALAPFGSERGRQSATRTSRIVRTGGSAPVAIAGSVPPAGIGFMPTVNSGVQFGQSTGPVGAAPPRTSSAKAIVLGGFAGLAALGLAGGGLYAWREHRLVATASASTPDGGLVPAPSAPSNAPGGVQLNGPVASASSTSNAPDVVPSSSSALVTKDAGASPVSPAAKDAGAAPPKKDAGAAPAPQAPAADLEGPKRVASQRCDHARFMLSRNDAKSNDQAKTVKNMECLMASSMSPNSGAANCDRAVCRQACMLLQDQACIRSLDYAERANPLPF